MAVWNERTIEMLDLVYKKCKHHQVIKYDREMLIAKPEVMFEVALLNLNLVHVFGCEGQIDDSVNLFYPWIASSTVFIPRNFQISLNCIKKNAG